MNENKENEVNNVESEVNQSTNTTPTNDKKGFSIAALVLGIIALVLCCIWYVSIPCGIIALILAKEECQLQELLQVLLVWY